MKHNDLREIPGNAGDKNPFRPVLLTGMMTCLSIGVVNLIKTINPSWYGKYLLIGIMFVTVEAIYSYRTLKKRGITGDINIRYHLVEWGILVVILKALTYWGDPLEAIEADIKSWGMEPLNFFNMEFILLCVVSFPIWSATNKSIKAFDAMFDQFLVKSGDTDPFGNLMNRFYCGGLILVAVSGITQYISRSNTRILPHFNQPDITGVFINVLVYFVLGLILLSRTQIDIQLKKWRLHKVDVPANVIKRWTLQGIIFLVLIGAAAFVLPRSYSLGFLASIELILQYGIKLFLFLVQLVWAVTFFALKWLLSFFHFDDESPHKESWERPMFSGEFETASPESDTVYSLIFWLVLSVVAVYLLRTYIKDHPKLLEWIKHIKFRFSWLTKLWQWLNGGVRAVVELFPARPALKANDLHKKNALKRPFLQLRSMTIRQRVMYYYLNILKRAEEKGIRRRDDQTPREFAPVLSDNLPGLDDKIDEITKAFIRARYSRDKFEPQEVNSLKIAWKQIKSGLRKGKKI